jgi:hypothetical protein
VARGRNSFNCPSLGPVSVGRPDIRPASMWLAVGITSTVLLWDQSVWADLTSGRLPCGLRSGKFELSLCKNTQNKNTLTKIYNIKLIAHYSKFVIIKTFQNTSTGNHYFLKTFNSEITMVDLCPYSEPIRLNKK